uniref:Uncharacterized protein n=1 Tax=Branchiostoma floridae TaxID=7739 RepID=C3YVQ6_BRAFL|eukprot:XP_002599578.1 hypothetical protein BRAFLDRAFT_77677 [Branchiostoma floridae]
MSTRTRPEGKHPCANTTYHEIAEIVYLFIENYCSKVHKASSRRPVRQEGQVALVRGCGISEPQVTTAYSYHATYRSIAFAEARLSPVLLQNHSLPQATTVYHAPYRGLPKVRKGTKRNEKERKGTNRNEV